MGAFKCHFYVVVHVVVHVLVHVGVHVLVHVVVVAAAVTHNQDPRRKHRINFGHWLLTTAP